MVMDYLIEETLLIWKMTNDLMSQILATQKIYGGMLGTIKKTINSNSKAIQQKFGTFL